jgi:hypothetical protein
MTNASEWISVGALGEAFGPDANLLPHIASLSGASFRLQLEDGTACDVQLLSATELHWRATQVPRGSKLQIQDVTAPYRATEIRTGIVLLSFLPGEGSTNAVTVVLDRSRGIATLILGQLPTRSEAAETLLERIARGAELTSVRATFVAGAIDAPFTPTTARHEETRELIGKRIEYTYSSTERYEHIYLNEALYCWHCLSGSEKGLADTDRCHYRKIAPDLFLFVWREKIVPTLGIVLVDLAQLKTTGQIFGYRGFDFGAVTSFPVGARARIVSVT